LGKKLAETKVLITGAGGFIGSHLCELAVERGADVRAFVHYNSRSDWGMLKDVDARTRRSIEIVAGDLRDSSSVRQAVRGCGYIFHLGALIGIPYSYASPADVLATNVLGSLHVLEACRDAPIERLVQTSTSEVYGTAQYVPMDEAHPLHPQSPYAASKVGSDKLAESYFRSFGLPVTVVRPFNTYGPRQSPRAVVPTIVTQALRSGKVRLGNLEPRRDMVYVSDTARGFLAAATSVKCVGETVQLGSERDVSVRELVTAVERIVGRKLAVVTDARRRRPMGSVVERLHASSARARRLLGWRAEVTLEAGLAATVDWFRSRIDGYSAGVYHV
jgi:dTDP-glucose 4,6-dehydratase